MFADSPSGGKSDQSADASAGRSFLLHQAEVKEATDSAARTASGLPPNYVPVLMRGSRVKGPLLFWSEGVARTEEQQRAANSAGVW